MMYAVEWTKRALDELEKLESSISKRILKKVDELSNNSFFKDIKKLRNMKGYRLRIGDYRVIFEIEDGVIYITKLGHRKNIYK